MTEQTTNFNSVAPLRNVAALVTLIQELEGRGVGLPGLGVFFGYSGFGKTFAATYASSKFQTISVKANSVWTKKKFCQTVLAEMGTKPAKTVADMVDQIAENLARTRVPMIIDEADHVVSRGMIEMIRDIHDSSLASIVLIGEEELPQKLRRWERVDGRILRWVAAEPGNADDLDQLARIRVPGVSLEAHLKDYILKISSGSLRRMSTNLDIIREFSATTGTNVVTLNALGEKTLFTGEAPTPRRGIAV